MKSRRERDLVKRTGNYKRERSIGNSLRESVACRLIVRYVVDERELAQKVGFSRDEASK